MLRALQPILARLREMRRQVVLLSAAGLLALVAIVFFVMAIYMRLALALGGPAAAALLGLVFAIAALVVLFLARKRHVRPAPPVAAPVAPARPLEALLVAFLLGVIEEQFGRRRR